MGTTTPPIRRQSGSGDLSNSWKTTAVDGVENPHQSVKEPRGALGDETFSLGGQYQLM